MVDLTAPRRRPGIHRPHILVSELVDFLRVRPSDPRGKLKWAMYDTDVAPALKQSIKVHGQLTAQSRETRIYVLFYRVFVTGTVFYASYLDDTGQSKRFKRRR